MKKEKKTFLANTLKDKQVIFKRSYGIFSSGNINRSKTAFLIVLMSLCFVRIHAQFGSNYDLEANGQYVAGNNSDASFQNYNLDLRLFKIPMDKENSSLIELSVQYGYVAIDFTDNSPVFKDLETFNNAGVTISYSKPLKNQKWSFGGIVNPQLVSNFKDCDITFDDFYLNAAVLFNYSKTENSLMSLGLAYSNTLGFPAPIPIFNYWKKWNDNWEINLGILRTNLTRNLSQYSSISGYTEVKGFNGNIGKDLQNNMFKRNRKGQRISYTDILSGLEYKYQQKNFQFKLNVGYTIFREFKLQNSDYDTAYTFDMKNNLSAGTSFAFNF